MSNNNVSVLRTALAAAALFVLMAASNSTKAQEPAKTSPDAKQTNQSTEVKQLNDRVEMLEQTIKELKAQMTAIETAKKAPPKIDIVDAAYQTGTDTASTSISTATAASAKTAGSAKSRLSPISPRDEEKGDSTLQVY